MNDVDGYLRDSRRKSVVRSGAQIVAMAVLRTPIAAYFCNGLNLSIHDANQLQREVVIDRLVRIKWHMAIVDFKDHRR